MMTFGVAQRLRSRFVTACATAFPFSILGFIEYVDWFRRENA
jgi:hypothetical protein